MDKKLMFCLVLVGVVVLNNCTRARKTTCGKKRIKENREMRFVPASPAPVDAKLKHIARPKNYKEKVAPKAKPIFPKKVAKKKVAKKGIIARLIGRDEKKKNKPKSVVKKRQKRVGLMERLFGKQDEKKKKVEPKKTATRDEDYIKLRNEEMIATLYK